MIAADTIHAHPLLTGAGLRVRVPTEGREWDLVSSYVASSLPEPQAGCHREVFIEPRVVHGFPDAVVVYWNHERALSLRTYGARLGFAELRMLHLVAEASSLPRRRLAELAGSRSSRTLDRLLEYGLLDHGAEEGVRLSPRSTFCVERLIAIESKIGNWRKGIEQAVHNTWFASESYLLMPSLPCASDLLPTAQACGVGVLTANTKLDSPVWPARADDLPKSYGSWLFNDWVKWLE